MQAKKTFSFVLPLLVFLFLWEALARSGLVSIALFPPPTRVFSALFALLSEGFMLDILASIKRALAGLVLGSFLGVLIGLATGRISFVDKNLSPILHIFRALPPVALIPLFIVWFGIGDSSKVLSIALAVLFVAWLNTHIGAQRVPVHYIRAASMLTKSGGGLKTMKDVVFPATLPFSIAGIRNGIAIAFIMVYVSELAGASQGIGYWIEVSQMTYAIDKMVAALAVLGLLAAATDTAFVKLTQRVFPWMQKL
ncbi:ABC transporter permease [Candidatus Micrarchaeota archaeon]|nr:ABC transporter permease [Candidatus Micrarchaeota archaeon]